MPRATSSAGAPLNSTRRGTSSSEDMQRPASAAGPSRPHGPPQPFMQDPHPHSLQGSPQFWAPPLPNGHHYAHPEDFHPIVDASAPAPWPETHRIAIQLPDGQIVMHDVHSAPGTRRPSVSSAVQMPFDPAAEEEETVPIDDGHGQDLFTPYHGHADAYSMSAGPSSGPRHAMQYGGGPPMSQTSPLPMAPPMHNMGGYTSPTDSMHLHPAPYATPMPISAPLNSQHHAYRRDGPPPPRPNLQHRHTTAVAGPRQPPLQRHFSADGTHPGHPQVQVHDVFAAPTGSTPRRPGPFEHLPGFAYEQDFMPDQGISPARALGPAPVPQHFSPHHDDPLITPLQQKGGYAQQIRSSLTPSTVRSHASTMSVTSNSSSAMTDATYRRPMDASSEDENDSPTRGPSNRKARIQLNAPGMPPPGARRPVNTVVRTARPGQPAAAAAVAAKPVVSGGRTSAKFSKVADDPGVEGIPAGPRPLDRPGPSFACIIGQAILRCAAGGLSLEHIYRYVETAYPFFKGGDGAWRNSVRHNLSIHKMFETIPRTEKFPAGKGGIWIIHEEEKCHWPSEDKFIKNFPPSHPHHAVCRQTQHERQKEVEAMAKAKAEGREYVPKKGKKARKLPLESAEGMEMTRSFSHLSDVSASMPCPASSSGQASSGSASGGEDSSSTPKITPALLQPPSMVEPDFTAIESDFVPIESHDEPDFAAYTSDPAEPEQENEPSPSMPPSSVPRPANLATRFGMQRIRPLEDEENVFLSSGSSSKRARVAGPLGEISPIPQGSIRHPGSYVTPERERGDSSHKMSLGSSVFKTPALINTSSSPGSSPMPPTIGRDAQRNPSALQQAWTTDDFVAMAPDSPPPSRVAGGSFSLDAAFDIKPKAIISHRRMLDEDPVLPIVPSPRAPPKTPLTRSSAARDHQTPRPNLGRTPFKTPMFGGSPYLPLPLGSELSTPAWEMSGVLHRLQGGMESPTRTGLRSPSIMRSPMPSTDPLKYAILMNSGSPKKAKCLVD